MKRFTDTLKWADPWFRKLPPALKCFWSYIVDNCDCTGVWKIDMELASFQIGFDFTEEKILEVFEGRIERFRTDCLRVLRFIEFQYGELSRDCRAHLPIFRMIEKHRLCDTLLIGYPKATGSLKEEEQEKEEDKEAEKEKGSAEGKQRFEAPSESEVRLLFEKGGCPVETEVQKFFGHYGSNGWRVGKNPMRSVPHAVGGWIARWRADGGDRRASKSNGHKPGDYNPNATYAEDTM